MAYPFAKSPGTWGSLIHGKLRYKFGRMWWRLSTRISKRLSKSLA